MRDKRRFFIAAAAFIFIYGAFPFLVKAQLIMTEVMYDLEGADSGREWIEVQNIGDTPVNFASWKLFEADTNHKINSIGTPEIAPQAFAVIADDSQKFLADHADFGGLLFDSAFSLSNAGEALALKDETGAEKDSFSYLPTMGAAGDGSSLQKTMAGEWLARLPTPGRANQSSIATVQFETASTSQQNLSQGNEMPDQSFSSHSSPASLSATYGPPELEVSAGRTRLGYVGVPIRFEAKTKSAINIPQGNAVSNIWSMGDGSRLYGQFISHIYDFPGEYIVVLNSQSGGASAASKTRVKIIEPPVKIISASDDFIEIENLGADDLNLGGFYLESENGRFIIPEDTLIVSGGSVKLSSMTTKLFSVGRFVKLTNQKSAVICLKII